MLKYLFWEKGYPGITAVGKWEGS